MKRKLSIASWALFIIVTPLTFLGIIAQNTIPGDFLYSIKRTYEGGALLAFSVFPSAKADYTTNLASTRFTEAEKLIVKKSDTQGLTALVTQVQQAKQEISIVSDPKQKEELQQKLLASITQYQQGLNVMAAQVATQNSIAFVPTTINEPVQNTADMPPSQQETQQPQQQFNQSPKQSFPQQNTQQSPQPTQNPSPTPTLIQPVPTTSSTTGAGSTPADIISSIQNTQGTLNTLKKQVQQSQMMISPTPFPSPTIYTSPTKLPTPTYYYHKPSSKISPTKRPSSKSGDSSDSGSDSGD